MNQQQAKRQIPTKPPYALMALVAAAAIVLAMIAWALWDAFTSPVEDGLEYKGSIERVTPLHNGDRPAVRATWPDRLPS